MNKISCSASSLKTGEQLFGTAPKVKDWLLIEYHHHWEEDALDKSKIPNEVKKYLSELQNSFDCLRVQLISRDNDIAKGNQNSDAPINFYYAKSSEFDPKLYKFEFESYEEILDIGLKELIQNGYNEKLETEEKLILVCTHGRYDRCCGKYGIQVYNEIKREEGFSSWKTTHVGGHRFSSNLVILPEGIYYGRVDTINIEKILDAHLKAEIYLDCFRGRSCYSQISQVSEYFLRCKIGKTGIYDIKWEFEKDSDTYTEVEFNVESENLIYSVNTIVLNNALEIYPNCGNSSPKKIPQFYFYSLIPYTPKQEF